MKLRLQPKCGCQDCHERVADLERQLAECAQIVADWDAVFSMIAPRQAIADRRKAARPKLRAVRGGKDGL